MLSLISLGTMLDITQGPIVICAQETSSIMASVLAGREVTLLSAEQLFELPVECYSQVALVEIDIDDDPE